MALENLTPSNRMEAILDGQDIEPSNRKEYFMQKAVSAGGSSLPPSYSSSDIGKVLTVGEGEGGTAEPKWENVGGVVTITLPDELNTLLMSTLQSRAPAAISAAGMPVYNNAVGSAASDLNALNALYTEIVNANSEGRALRLNGGALVTQATGNVNDTARINFSYKMYVYSTYVFNIDLEIEINPYAEYDNYGISSVITLVSRLVVS